MIMRRILFVILAVLVVAMAGICAMFAHDMATARARLVTRAKTRTENRLRQQAEALGFRPSPAINTTS
jgi:hypothetical protein